MSLASIAPAVPMYARPTQTSERYLLKALANKMARDESSPPMTDGDCTCYDAIDAVCTNLNPFVDTHLHTHTVLGFTLTKSNYTFKFN